MALNNIKLQLGHVQCMVNLCLPLACIIGDVEGANAISGHNGNKTKDCP